MRDTFRADPKDLGTILRCRNTNRYFTGDGWTENPDLAKPFPDEAEAMRACVTHGLKDVDVVIWKPPHTAPSLEARRTSG